MTVGQKWHSLQGDSRTCAVYNLTAGITISKEGSSEHFVGKQNPKVTLGQQIISWEE
jgi:hypothetical protein